MNNLIDTIIKTMKKNLITFDKKEHKDKIFLTLETLVSHYLNKNAII